MDKRRKVKVRRSEPEDTDRDLSNKVQVAFGIKILIKNCEKLVMFFRRMEKDIVINESR